MSIFHNAWGSPVNRLWNYNPGHICQIIHHIIFDPKAIPFPFLDINVRTWETPAEGKGVASRILECYRPYCHPLILGGHGASPAGSTVQEWWPGHILCQHYLLVYPIVRHLRGEQIFGAICNDDWENGKKKLPILPFCSACYKRKQ